MHNGQNSKLATDSGWQPTFIEYFQLATRSNGTDLLSATNGLFQTGGVIGTLTLPYFADKWGRKGGLAVVRDGLRIRRVWRCIC